MPAGRAAAISGSSADECHIRNIRSTNHWIDQNMVEMASGSAIASTSRPPQGRDHQPRSSAAAVLLITKLVMHSFPCSIAGRAKFREDERRRGTGEKWFAASG